MSIHQHPLAYLLGLEGIALMRAFAGEHDADFTQARIAEIRALLDRAEDFGDGVDVRPIPMAEGYDSWAPRYDGPGNPFFAMDESVLLPILDTLPPGDAIDAMCGTGRYAAHLADRGHRVRGFDTSPGMLDLARAKLPEVEFRSPTWPPCRSRDASADVVVNALAINHVDDLGPAFTEAARVLRPGGHLLLCSMVGYFLGLPALALPGVRRRRRDRVRLGVEPLDRGVPPGRPGCGLRRPRLPGARGRRAAGRVRARARAASARSARVHLGPPPLGGDGGGRRTQRPGLPGGVALPAAVTDAISAPDGPRTRTPGRRSRPARR